MSCLTQIKAKKKPKRNDQEVLEYYDFPQELFDEIKEKCNKEEMLENENVLNNELRISSSLTNEQRLNKLEQFLFKNPIPFIRLANCKMGRYLKVHGNLILISSDLQHSMDKILPQKQQIIPVSLKRKLHYKGFYIEEWVDVKKVQIYFNWFKEHNPFFKDVEFRENRLEEFDQGLMEDIEEYRNCPGRNSENGKDYNNISDDGDECIDDEIDIDLRHSINPIEIKDEITVQHHDSVMCNKYEHEHVDDSVVRRYAK